MGLSRWKCVRDTKEPLRGAADGTNENPIVKEDLGEVGRGYICLRIKIHLTRR